MLGKKQFPPVRPITQTGFSLVEIMVALVIGMLGIVVMMQTFSLFEGQRRTTTGGDDAISSGAIVLHGLTRDLQQAGWGIGAMNIIGCEVSGLTQGNVPLTLAPVLINPRKAGKDPNSTADSDLLIPKGDDNTDTLLVLAGNSNGIVEGVEIETNQGVQKGAGAGEYTLTTNARKFIVNASSAFAKDNLVVGGLRERAAGRCELTSAKVLTANARVLELSDDIKVKIAGGSDITPGKWDRLYQFGSNPVIRAYAIRGGNLTVCDWRKSNCSDATKSADSGVWVPIGNNIVSLRAQYARDTADGSMDGTPDLWDQSIATPDSSPPISTVTKKNNQACAIKRIPAVRLVLVARSSQPEKRNDGTLTSAEYVTKIAPRWAGSKCAKNEGGSDVEAGCSTSNPDSGAADIKFSSAEAAWPTWQDYRYKVFQTIVPLRNIFVQEIPQGAGSEGFEC